MRTDADGRLKKHKKNRLFIEHECYIILYYIMKNMKIDLRSKHICSPILCTWERTFVCNLAQLRKAALIFACLWPLLLFEGQCIFKICLKKMYTIAGCFTDFSNSGVAVFLF